jgi:hypothetical protein
MMMVLTRQQRQIMAHFASHLPAVKRAAFEAHVMEALKHRRDGDPGQVMTRICVDTITSLDRGEAAKKIRQNV